MTDTLAARCIALIADLGLGRAEDVTSVVPLTGGVASDIARVDVAGQSYCVKFPLPQLRVAETWFAPAHRSRTEYAWLSVAGDCVPGAVPRLHGFSERLNGFAMEFIAGPDVRLWKALLLAGEVRPGAAAQVAAVLGRVHAAASVTGFDSSPFRNHADFHVLRVEPYLHFTATRYPDLGLPLRALADALDASDINLMHGDVSPKNILFRGDAPILLDAECASLGDPAFDVAFCLNHLLLKSLHLPEAAPTLRAEVRGFWQTYRQAIRWEAPEAFEARLAALLPALMLARVDGKSPVEYLTETTRAGVRALAIPLIRKPVRLLEDVLHQLVTKEP